MLTVRAKTNAAHSDRDDRPTGADRVSVTNDLFVVPTKQADGRGM